MPFTPRRFPIRRFSLSGLMFLLPAMLLIEPFSMASGDETIVNAHPDPKYGPAIPFRKVPGTSGTLALEISGGRLYALEDGGLSIYDIADPLKPRKLGSVGGMGNVRQLRVRGETAFLTSRQFGLWTVDVSDETHPRIISNFDAVEMATGLDAAGDVAFIGNRVYGIQCVDVSDPARMKHLSSYRTDESQSVTYRDGLLFSGDWAGGEVTVLDVSDPSAPKPVSELKLDGYGDGMAVRGDLLFASTGQHRKSGPEEERYGAGHGLDIFDISDPRNPVKLSKTAFPSIYFGPCDYWTPRLSGRYCFASDTVNGLFLLDIYDPRAPKILGNLVLPKSDPENAAIHVPYDQIMDPGIPQGDPVSSIAVGDGVLYLSGNFTGIYLAELPGIAVPEPRDVGTLPLLPEHPYPGENAEEFYTSGPELSQPTRAVAVRGDIAYTANVWDGLKIYRLSEADGITRIGAVDIEYAADVKRSGDRLYVAEGQNGIGVYRIKTDTEIEEIGRLPVLEKGRSLVQFLWAFEGIDTIAATCAATRVHFVDFSDPAKPEILLSKGAGQLLYGNYGTQDLAAGRYFGLTRHGGGFMVFDLHERSAGEVWFDSFPMCSQTGSVAAMGEELLVMRAGGYALFDPTHPVATRELERHRFPGQVELPEDVPDDSAISRSLFPKSEWEGMPYCDENSGRLAVVNRIFKNVRTYDFSDRDHPRALKHFELKSNAFAPTFWKGRLLLPGHYSGLLLEK
ncbi:MAG: beta-propeller domain-containing protein [Verrucomicrobiae bacterium]|nr:beta-propeller domain-containing protein [Verrucomicrobiae bacterium]